AAKPLRTIAIGMLGGVVVGLTSVGSGSLMIILLLFLYPMIGANQLVGTDLTQAVPLTAAAALGALIFTHVQFGVTVSLVLGSVPAVYVGSLLSSSAPDRYIRPVITFVIAASGLKYVGIDTETLGWILCAALFAIGGAWLFVKRPWSRASPALQLAGRRENDVTSPPNPLTHLIRTEAPEIAELDGAAASRERGERRPP